jgi:hypothetical protein
MQTLIIERDDGRKTILTGDYMVTVKVGRDRVGSPTLILEQIQIQPRPAERRDRFYLFRCIAIQGEVAKAHFDSQKARRGMTSIDFGIAT